MWLVAVFLGCCGVGVLHFRVDAEYQDWLVHRGKGGGECTLARVCALFIFTQQKDIDSESNTRSETKQRIDLRACLQLRRIRGNDEHAQPSIAGNQRNGDSGLGRNPIRIMSFLLQILHECRLFLRPRDAYRTALNWLDNALHYLARA